MLTALLLALQVLQVGEVPSASARPLAYSGRDGQTAVDIPRLEAEARIDGVLDDDVWQRAALLHGFSQYRPVEGIASDDSTHVYIWYTSHSIYFGIRAFAPPGSTRAKLAERDKIDADDFVQIMLDTFDDRRQAFVFGVNPLGVQSDGIRVEGNGGAVANNVDPSMDFLYESKGRLTEHGYEVEVRVPFKSLRYQSSNPQNWGINIFRKIQYSGFEDTWTRTAKAASFLAQSGSIRGLREMSRGLVLEMNPVMTTRLAGESRADSWRYSGTPEFGGNVRWGVTPNLTLNGTINPDFSQVEADAGQVAADARFALSFAEKRPFFVEGAEQFQTPNSIVYTRRIANPVAAAKVTGKMAGTSIGVLSALDDRTSSANGLEHPLFNLVRLRRDIGGQSTAGITYTDRIDGDNYNRVLNGDVRYVFRKVYFIQAQWAQSFTQSAGNKLDGPLWQLWYDRTGRLWGFGYNVLGIARDFRALSGFVSRTDVVQARFLNRFSIYPKRGGLIQLWNVSPSVNWFYDYDDFLSGGGPREFKSSLAHAITLRRGWSAGFSTIYERFNFDREFHAGQYVQQRVDGQDVYVPYYIGDIALARALSINVTTPQFPRFSSTFKTIFGEDADFYEHATSKVLTINWTGDWLPTQKLRLQGMYTHQQHRRARDGTLIDRARIPRLKAEYQISRPFFVRAVAQYDARTRSALRDPRTDAPILVRSANGTYSPAGATSLNDFRLDWLISYRPGPGTVFFLGYGSSLTEPESFRFREIDRVNDAFFVKLSYLFRM